MDLPTLKECEERRIRGAEERKRADARRQAMIDQLATDIARGVVWDDLDIEARAWLLGASPAAFSAFVSRVCETAKQLQKDSKFAKGKK